ncbi:hypothetical protein ACQV5J_16000 [Leptospira interrogans]|uniref:Uncharacterized protein n=3 Tax=Leptospira interrogans TaxID=173 RepID=A0A0E2D8L9_LEPIR|nr:hypothetical protein [Leptospira interrogans]AKH77091.1 hypothetical protein BRAT_08520 [Leptospira interrogans serovar Bratislava]EKO89818.1 hypothetical protein LEP1GSC009_1270 [Leptospira interrogans serovar Grippotyphosa str. Andaman]EKP84636.1 hypothetical protein LEP1GSC020_4214 [Leptospira interrogans serovar Grippotyphosa str. 2006006986]EKR55811.1 hypothetical protein LEP1GSC105_2167 [Leptospira interrogans str. UI 12758]EMJ53906.1 hypothetical protein LEP1GSC111_0103 [Leptospira i
MPLDEPFEVGYRGIVEPVTITVKHQTLTKADEGKPAKFTANMEVSLCADGDSPAGQIVVVDEKGKILGLKLFGVFEYEYSGPDPAPGYLSIQADGAGKIKSIPSGGIRVLVISVDTGTKKLACII